MAHFAFIYRDPSGADSAEVKELASVDEARSHALLSAHERQGPFDDERMTASVCLMDGEDASEIGCWICLGQAGWVWIDSSAGRDPYGDFDTPLGA